MAQYSTTNVEEFHAYHCGKCSGINIRLLQDPESKGFVFQCIECLGLLTGLNKVLGMSPAPVVVEEEASFDELSEGSEFTEGSSGRDSAGEGEDLLV